MKPGIVLGADTYHHPRNACRKACARENKEIPDSIHAQSLEKFPRPVRTSDWAAHMRAFSFALAWS